MIMNKKEFVKILKEAKETLPQSEYVIFLEFVSDKVNEELEMIEHEILDKI